MSDGPPDPEDDQSPDQTVGGDDERWGDATAWSPFRLAGFRYLWGGALSWVMTRELRILVTSYWLFETTGEASQLALIGAVQLVVQIPALLWSGTLADRVDRRRMLVVTQAVSVALMLVMGILDLGGQLQPWHVYLAIAAMASTNVMGSPAQAALLPSVVPDRWLVQGVVAQTITQQATAVVAPLLFALVAGLMNVTATFFLTAAIAVPSLVLPLMIRIRFQPPLVREAGSTAQRTWEGFRFVRGHRLLPGLYILDGGITVFSFYRQLFPLFARELYGGGATATGLLTAANSVGGIFGTLLVLFLRNYRAKGMLVLYSTIVYALLLFPLAVVGQLWVGMILIGGLGAMDGISVAMRQSIVQLTTPDQMRGRAMALQTLAAQTANNLGTLEVGYLSVAAGLSFTLAFGGAAALAFTLGAWRLVPSIRKYRYP
ncbi:MAG: MFS transporter [Chloroflexi bacterium]|nr:MFS transporter [Chloroflexota bacterium]MDA1146629.1 MFS transporter [Chloroflexota bacterium]MQC82827.1 MFS transporter [Chloroflexota bacterium]